MDRSRSTATAARSPTSWPSSGLTRASSPCIADDSLPFGGDRTYELRDLNGATELTISAHGFVKPAVFRARATYVFGHQRTLERYLSALASASARS